jgi:hypothetical protein
MIISLAMKNKFIHFTIFVTSLILLSDVGASTTIPLSFKYIDHKGRLYSTVLQTHSQLSRATLFNQETSYEMVSLDSIDPMPNPDKLRTTIDNFLILTSFLKYKPIHQCQYLLTAVFNDDNRDKTRNRNMDLGVITQELKLQLTLSCTYYSGQTNTTNLGNIDILRISPRSDIYGMCVKIGSGFDQSDVACPMALEEPKKLSPGFYLADELKTEESKSKINARTPLMSTIDFVNKHRAAIIDYFNGEYQNLENGPRTPAIVNH